MNMRACALPRLLLGELVTPIPTCGFNVETIFRSGGQIVT
jgi:hypothetical protein